MAEGWTDQIGNIGLEGLEGCAPSSAGVYVDASREHLVMPLDMGQRLLAEHRELVEALELAWAAMNHMGDVLNSMDAVLEQDVAVTSEAFEKVPALLSRIKEPGQGREE